MCKKKKECDTYSSGTRKAFGWIRVIEPSLLSQIILAKDTFSISANWSEKNKRKNNVEFYELDVASVVSLQVHVLRSCLEKEKVSVTWS